jgi:hypothetical protein
MDFPMVIPLMAGMDTAQLQVTFIMDRVISILLRYTLLLLQCRPVQLLLLLQLTLRLSRVPVTLMTLSLRWTFEA